MINIFFLQFLNKSIKYIYCEYNNLVAYLNDEGNYNEVSCSRCYKQNSPRNTTARFVSVLITIINFNYLI